jgi:signal peptidase I
VSPRPDPLRRAVSRSLDVVGVLSAVLGAAIASWWIVSSAFGVALVTFQTGSMTPTYDTGALAVSTPVRLADVHPGDVVTVGRGPHELPITHRVVSIRLTADGAVLRLKGDANHDPDPHPYEVTAVRLVVAGVPWFLAPLTWLARPIGALAAVALATLAVGRAFWPRRDPARPRGRRSAHAPGVLQLR